MWKAGLAIVVAALLGPTAALAAPDDPGAALKSAASECLRSNAARVAATAKTLEEAVSFLVDDLCARQVSRASTYALSVRTLDSWRAYPPKPRFTVSAAHPTLSEFEQRQNADAEQNAELLKQAKVNPTTGDLETPPGLQPDLKSWNIMASVEASSSVQADFKATAAEAVLAAKEASAKH